MPMRSANTAAKPYVLGRSRFAAITAVEGLKLSRDGEALCNALVPSPQNNAAQRLFGPSLKHGSADDL
jgi:hypothetical protein